eukprot:349679-Chlamydomonas_euryale.AAC.12
MGGWLAGWLAGSMIGRVACSPEEKISVLAGWLYERLDGWLRRQAIDRSHAAVVEASVGCADMWGWFGRHTKPFELHTCKALPFAPRQVIMARGKELILSEKKCRAGYGVHLPVAFSELVSSEGRTFDEFAAAVQSTWDKTWSTAYGVDLKGVTFDLEGVMHDPVTLSPLPRRRGAEWVTAGRSAASGGTAACYLAWLATRRRSHIALYAAGAIAPSPTKSTLLVCNLNFLLGSRCHPGVGAQPLHRRDRLPKHDCGQMEVLAVHPC